MTRKLMTIAVAVVLIQAFVAVGADAELLSINKIGQGTTSPAAPGVHWYFWATPVTVRAYPAAGWSFDHWEGAFWSTNTSKTMTMWNDYRVTAVFRPNVPSPANALERFVGAGDLAFSWSEYDTDAHAGWDKYTLILNSQQWRSGAEVDRPVWEHDLGLIQPWFSGDQVVMLINGGSNDPDPPEEVDTDYALVAFTYGITFAQLDQVPNEPLYFTDEVDRRRTEDEIIAYSFDKYLDTGDYTWPCHLAMAKAGYRAMDTIQEYLPGKKNFLVAGGSKRGWTTYLLAAVDKRVKAMAPLSIDILNVAQQMRHHWEAYGFWAPAVTDYVEFDLFCRMGGYLGPELLQIEDPYSYISRYTIPKYVVASGGDQFFLPDSSQYYWNSMPGPKWLRYSVNTDHSQEQDDTMLPSLLYWADLALDNPGALPTINSGMEIDGSVWIIASTAPVEVKLWQATNPNARDFRLEAVGPIWTSSPLYDQGGNTFIANVPAPAQGWTAFLVEARFAGDFYLTSGIRIKPDTLPFAGTACL